MTKHKMIDYGNVYEAILADNRQMRQRIAELERTQGVPLDEDAFDDMIHKAATEPVSIPIAQPKPAMPREYTQDEVRELFLRRVWQLVEEWDTEEYSQRYKLEALAFSILDELDANYTVIPVPDMRKYRLNISGSLHTLFHEVGKKR